MTGRERRKPLQPAPAPTREGLTPAQSATLATLEHFHWSLRFVRRPLFQDPVPVLFDRENRRYVVIEPDGSVNEQQALRLRD